MIIKQKPSPKHQFSRGHKTLLREELNKKVRKAMIHGYGKELFEGSSDYLVLSKMDPQK